MGEKEVGVIYLILSLKWTRSSEVLVWYRPNAAGYTAIVDDAGHYTAEDAKLHVMEDVTAAVPLDTAMMFARNVVIRERLNELLAQTKEKI